ncbi:MAG: type II secretion system protein [Candidatus Doudnabacteria bacterium]|nr:type II secretion system protein [Candidatus Doudnabacteria bacterium]
MDLKRQTQQGFTLIELLVVVAIIGLLSSAILVGMGNARIRARDARRLSDVQQVKSGLDVHYNVASGYPSTADWNTAQSASAFLTCSGQNTVKPPQDPTAAQVYAYTQGGNSTTGCATTVYSDYKLEFTTEGATTIGPAGVYYLSPRGITTTPPF